MKTKQFANSLLFLLFIFCIAGIGALILWPHILTGEMTRWEQISNLVPLAVILLYSIGYGMYCLITNKWKPAGISVS